MKKYLAVVMAVLIALCAFMMTGCASKTNVITKTTMPGTYDIDKDTFQRYVSIVTNGYGENCHFVKKIDATGYDAYGYENIGFSVDFHPQYIFEQKYEDVTVTCAVTYNYVQYLASTKTQKVYSDEIEFTVQLDENGKAFYTYVQPFGLEDNVYCQYAFTPKVTKIEVLEASGKVTYLPRDTQYDFIAKPTPTPAAK